MFTEVRVYLEEVRSHLHLDQMTEKKVIWELNTYFKEKLAELKEQGISGAAAVKEAIKSCGRAREVGRLTYEAYSQGSLTDALVASLPHFIVGALFLFHLWNNPFLLAVVYGFILVVTLLGWWSGKPNWLYSWVGYALIPLVVGSYLAAPVLWRVVSSVLAGNMDIGIWIYLAVIVGFFAFALGIIVQTTIRVVKRDWLLASMMLIPVPIFSSWLVYASRAGEFVFMAETAMYEWDIAMASVLLALGVTSAVFIRLRQRILKAAAIVIMGPLSGGIIAHHFWGNIGLFGVLATALFTLLFLIGPAVLEATIGHGEVKKEAWWSGDWLENPSEMNS